MEKHNWIKNPFVDNANAPQGFTSLEAEQFIDLSFDPTLKSIYKPNSLISFCVKARSEFPLVGSCSWAVCNVILVWSRFICGSSNQVEVLQQDWHWTRHACCNIKHCTAVW